MENGQNEENAEIEKSGWKGSNEKMKRLKKIECQETQAKTEKPIVRVQESGV